MALWLKQSTIFVFRAGPMLDSTDGVTPEAGLTIAQADIQISKAGGAFAQTSAASPTTTYDADGYYQCPLTATDTGTLGTLVVEIQMAGALPVWHEFMVVPANVFDSIVSGSDYLDAEVAAMAAGTVTAAAIATGAIDADAVAADAVTEIVSGLLTTDLAGYEATGTGTRLADMLVLMRACLAGRIALDDTTLTVYEADGTTAIATYTVAADGTTRSTPA